MRNAVYVLVMLGAASLNFLKMILAAVYLPPSQFAYYASTIGMASLCSMVVSLGRIETTTKFYPQLWVAGYARHTLHDALKAATVIGYRVLALAVLAACCSLASIVEVGLFSVVSFAVLVWSSVLLSLGAAIARGSGSVKILCCLSILRGALPLAAVWLTLPYQNWETLVWAEAAAVAAVVALSATVVFRAVSVHARESVPPTYPPPNRDDGAGRSLYVANVLSSALAFGDRATVTAFAGPGIGGAYAAIGLAPQAGALLAGILSQKVGPEIIRDAYAGSRSGLLRRHLWPPAQLMFAAGLIVAMSLVLGPLAVSPVGAFLSQRDIGMTSALLGSALVCAQYYLVLEFAAIAADNENIVLIASLTAFLTFGAGSLFLYWQEGGLNGYLATALCARLLQTSILASAISRNA